MLSELEKDFDAWWRCTGQGFMDKEPEIETGLRKQEFIYLLCRIAYCQGRIDEGTNVEEKIDQLRRDRIRRIAQ